MGDTISTLAVFSSIVATFVGFPLQIYRNYRHSMCDFSPFLIGGVIASAVLWSIHALLRKDGFLLTAHVPTIFFATIIGLQYLKYRKNGKNGKKSKQFRLGNGGLCGVVLSS